MTDETDERPLTGGALTALYHAINARVTAETAASGFDGVTLAHKPLLLNLGSPRRIGELARSSGLTKNAVVYLVNQLEQGGYVLREQDPSDGRATVVRLTPRGMALLDTTRRALVGLTAEWRAELGDTDWERFRSFVSRLAKLEAIRPMATRSAGRRPAEAH